jgi:mannose-binding lectin 1
VLTDAIATSEQLRLVPSMRSRKGAIWGKRQYIEEHWETELVFKITGQGRIGADGLVCLLLQHYA